MDVVIAYSFGFLCLALFYLLIFAIYKLTEWGNNRPNRGEEHDNCYSDSHKKNRIMKNELNQHFDELYETPNGYDDYIDNIDF